jgi:hypothetical protein
MWGTTLTLVTLPLSGSSSTNSRTALTRLSQERVLCLTDVQFVVRHPCFSCNVMPHNDRPRRAFYSKNRALIHAGSTYTSERSTLFKPKPAELDGPSRRRQSSPVVHIFSITPFLFCLLTPAPLTFESQSLLNAQSSPHRLIPTY